LFAMRQRFFRRRMAGFQPQVLSAALFYLDNKGWADSPHCPRISQEASFPKSHKEGRTP